MKAHILFAIAAAIGALLLLLRFIQQRPLHGYQVGLQFARSEK